MTTYYWLFILACRQVCKYLLPMLFDKNIIPLSYHLKQHKSSIPQFKDDFEYNYTKFILWWLRLILTII